MAVHFGYTHSHTGALHLRFWAKDINLQLKVHIIAFKDDIGDFVNPLELLLSKELKPLIGKSK